MFRLVYNISSELWTQLELFTFSHSSLIFADIAEAVESYEYELVLEIWIEYEPGVETLRAILCIFIQ